MKPDLDHQGGRFQMIVEFDMPAPAPSRAYLRRFVKDALETWGGQKHPEDELFHSLGQVSVKAISPMGKRSGSIKDTTSLLSPAGRATLRSMERR
jgi:hypothetical protein